MATVIGPNGARTYVPDDVAACLVGDGNTGYAMAAEPESSPTPAAAPKRAPRKRATARKTTD